MFDVLFICIFNNDIFHENFVYSIFDVYVAKTKFYKVKAIVGSSTRSTHSQTLKKCCQYTWGMISLFDFFYILQSVKFFILSVNYLCIKKFYFLHLLESSVDVESSES